MYVVFWRPEALRKPPNLRVEPPSWCPRCERVVAGQQTFKKPEYRWGRYGAQYYYSCPSCYPAGQAVFPGAFPASTIVDETIPAEAIGERARPLAKNTRARIKRGLERLASEPFSMRLLHGVNPRPLTLPLSTQTARHDAAMVLPVGGNTYETSPGNRAKDADLEPLKTVHGSLDRALVMANRMNNVPKVAGDEPAPPVLTGSQLGIVEVQKNGGVRSKAGPVHTVRAGGQHHGVVVSNYDPGWARRAEHGPFGSVTTRDGHSLVVPYSTQGASKVAEEQPVDTITRMEKATLVMPYYSNGKPVPSGRHPVATLTAKDRLSLVVPPIGEGEPEPVEVSDADIDACRFRMFSIAEIAAAMAMHLHPKGGPYKVLGNKREQMAQYGNGVTPPVMRFLVGCVAEEILA